MSVLFIFSLQGKTNSQPKPRSVSSWVILSFKGVIVVILPTLISNDVTFFEDSSFFSSTVRPPVPGVLSIPLVLPYLDFPSPHIDFMTRPHQVYTRPPTRPLVEASSMPQSSPAPVPQPSDDLPIVIRKGTCSTSNPCLIYNLLSFHHLSLPYFAFVSTLSSVSIPKSTSEALSHSS